MAAFFRFKSGDLNTKYGNNILILGFIGHTIFIMKKYLIYIIAIVLILGALGTLYYFYQNRPSMSPPSTFTHPSQDNSPATSSTPQSASAATLVYPISDFSARITTNGYGTYYPAGGTTNPDRQICPNATYYVGYHTADDLEVFPSELNSAIWAKSIAEGTVREARPVSGYGGLLVIEYELSGSIYTAYFGHINLSTATVKAGDHVTVGENLAELGPACSSANGDVRKHLHFGIRKGSAIDVRGYVPTQAELANWANPKVLLTDLGAK